MFFNSYSCVAEIFFLPLSSLRKRGYRRWGCSIGMPPLPRPPLSIGRLSPSSFPPAFGQSADFLRNIFTEAEFSPFTTPPSPPAALVGQKWRTAWGRKRGSRGIATLPHLAGAASSPFPTVSGRTIFPRMPAATGSPSTLFHPFRPLLLSQLHPYFTLLSILPPPPSFHLLPLHHPPFIHPLNPSPIAL